jgi:ferredoxin hydrogenase large subunit
MANMFEHDSRQIKFDVLVELCREAYNGDMSEEKVQGWARKLVSKDGPRYRCCIYKEREIIRQRVRLAMGKMANDVAEYNPRQIVQVIDAACDGCTIQKIRVTDNCRKCMAKSCVGACHFGAIHIGANRSEIDYTKCKECGSCARACPYNAIVVTERPCYAHCPVQAISWDENKIAKIDESKCINCGQCENACPFGAIEDISWVAPVASLLRMKTPTYAIVAPSIQGQFENATLSQIKKAIEMLGFEKCYEVAMGADAVAVSEAIELKEHKEAGIPMTTSCCPGFVNMLKIHFPTIYEKNKSTTYSPMMALANKLKKEHPDHGVVFIGPCLAKKQEAMEQNTPVDYVLTYEEIAAMLIARNIWVEEVEATEQSEATNFGRNFASGGGVHQAVMEAAKERGEGPYTAYYANGALECKKQLMLLKAGRFNFDILEGMCCDGGCIGGPATIVNSATAKARMTKENMSNPVKTITDSLNTNSFEGVKMHIGEHKENTEDGTN